MADDLAYSYRALDGTGRRVKGAIRARSEALAYEQLRRDGLSPLSLKRQAAAARANTQVSRLGDRESAEFLASLADLLRAGADIRTSLGILGDRFEKPAVRTVCQSLLADIAQGEALERSFARAFQKGQAFVASMVAAGEAAGDLPGGLQRASEVIAARLKLRDQLVSVLAYPSFVFLSAVGAVVVILLYIVPSIAPLAEDSGEAPPMALAVMIAASDAFRANGLLIGALAGAGVLALALAGALGLLSGPMERLSLDGPVRRTVGGLVFGGFAISLGSMLSAGAPVTDALRLATRSVGAKGARRRLEPVALAVREGQSLSRALGEVRSFPPAIIRLAAVGEATNSLGQMLARGGRIEEEAALRRIEAIGRIAGPALIIFLGLLLGVLMGGLLSGVSQMGQGALG